MPPPNELPVLADRRLSLATSLQVLKDLLPQTMPRHDKLEKVIDALKNDFNAGHFIYFTTPPPPDVTEFTKNYAQRVALTRIEADFRVMEQVVSQRLLYPNGSPMRKPLDIADKLAHCAFKCASTGNNNLLSLPPAVFTYFHKGARARVIPYATVAFVGIPTFCQGVKQDFLAIAHEVGHFLYWHSIIDRLIPDENTDHTKNFPDYIKRWMEEIVADVVGCIIGGPVLALAFQDIELATTETQFYEDDGKHPPPIVRPLIYIEALEQLDSTKYSETIKKLKERWEPHYDQTKDVIEEYDTGDSIPVNAILTEFNKVVTTILSVLPTDFKNIPCWSLASGDSDDLSPDDEVEKLYERFEATYEEIAGSIKDEELAAAAVTTTSWETWRKTVTDRLKRQKPLASKGDIWRRLLSADGWATVGPHSHPQPPEGP